MSAKNCLNLNLRRIYLSLIAIGILVFCIFKTYFPNQKIVKYTSFNESSVVLCESEIVDVNGNKSASSGVLLSIWSGYGLGNQLFFYAESYALSRRLRIPLFIEIVQEPSKEFSNNFRDFNYRGPTLPQFILPKGTFNLDRFNKSIPIVNADCQMALNRSWVTQEAVKGGKYFTIGSCGFGWKFFEDYKKELQGIRVKLEAPSEGYDTWRDLIAGAEWSVAVHVRRGDVMDSYWVPHIEYFQKAMRRMNMETPKGLKPTFFVFSDGMEWTKAGLVGNGFFLEELGAPVYFVSGSFGGFTNVEEFDLMMKCRSIVISSSTFSWWAAYLQEEGRNKVVIRPEFNYTRHDLMDVADGVGNKTAVDYSLGYPKEWIPMEA